MRKFLLGLAACTAMSAFAWDNPNLSTLFPVAGDIDGVDATPAAFKFNTYDGAFAGFTGTAHGSKNWNAANHLVQLMQTEDGVDFSNGQALICGPIFNLGVGVDNSANITGINASSKIIDLGGTCGKVLAITFKDSGFNEVAKNLTGVDYGLVDFSQSCYPIFFWVPNPTIMSNYAKGTGEKTLRCRVELNIYATTLGEDGILKAYINDDENNVHPSADNDATGILVNSSEFAKRWCDTDEAEFDDEVATEIAPYDEGDNGMEWYPNRWLVYEFDFDMNNEKTDDGLWNYAPKIKMEVPGTNTKDGVAVLFRNIQFYEPTSGCDIDTKTRKRTYNMYTVGEPNSSGVKNVAIDNNSKLQFSVNGNNVAFSEAATIYTLAGARVAAGTSVDLAKGVYVANANGKAVKFVVR